MRVTSAPSAAQDRAEPQPERAASTPDATESGDTPAGDTPAGAAPAAGEDPVQVEQGERKIEGAQEETGMEAGPEADARTDDGTDDQGDGWVDRAIDVPEEEPARDVRATWPTRLVDGMRRPAIRDLAVCLGLVAVAVWLTHGLWPDPARRVLALNVSDQALDEWFLAHGTRFYSGDLHLVTHLLNAPDGVNLLSNASLVLLGIVFAPITFAFGAPASFAIIVAGNLAGTAVAWYLLLTRTLRLRRFAATVGALYAGFAPGMMSQSNAHIHITAQWLVPPIVWCVIRLARTDEEVAEGRERVRRVLGTGALLGALITVQLFVGEEVLFLSAITLAMFCVAYAVLAPRTAGRMLWPLTAGLATAALIATAFLAYPLWLQFAGPQHVPNGPFSARYFAADVASFTAISPTSFAGDPSTDRLSTGATEYNTFFGLPLLLVTAGAVLWLWRRPVAMACAVTTAVMCALSLGPRLIIDGVRTDIHGPYSPLEGLPVLDGALPSRFALTAIPLIAVLLALALDAALDRGPAADPTTSVGWPRLLVPVAVLTALVPIAPTPLPTIAREPAPTFFTEGYWRTCVEPGGVLVPVPPAEPVDPDAMRWAAAANVEFGMPEGWFIGPYAAGGRASIGAYPRPTSELMHRVAKTGVIPQLTDNERAMASQDLQYWKASCVVLARQPHEAELRSMMDYLLGPGEDIADVRVWHAPKRAN
jgi:hypothetical protein